MEAVTGMFDFVNFGGLNMDGSADAYGVEWCVTELEGWWETPPLEQVLQQPTGLDEALVAASTLSGRPLVLRGTAHFTNCQGREAVVAARDRLAALLWPLLSPKLLTVSEGGVVRQSSVLPAGQQRVAHGGRSGVIFEVPLIAQDPRKYDVVQQVKSLPASVEVGGNVTTYPVLTLVSGGTVAITNTTLGSGATLTLSGAPAGTVVDMRRKTAYLGTANQYAHVRPNSVWWPLTPGTNVVTVSAGSVSIAWRDAWL